MAVFVVKFSQSDQADPDTHKNLACKCKSAIIQKYLKKKKKKRKQKPEKGKEKLQAALLMQQDQNDAHWLSIVVDSLVIASSSSSFSCMDTHNLAANLALKAIGKVLKGEKEREREKLLCPVFV